MTSRPRIVVGVDGSPGGRAALGWALAEAVRRAAAVDVVTAIPLHFYWTDAYLPDPQRVAALRAAAEAETRAVLTEQVRAVPGAGRLPVSLAVVSGAPGPTLVGHAGSDLLVVGSRGCGPLRSAALGSAALHCATHARGPVVVVHPPRDAGRPAPTVVVGVDGSQTSAAALRVALGEAARQGADVEVVVVEPAVRHGSDRTDQRLVERFVAEVLDRAPALAGPRVRVALESGDPGPVLVRRADGAALLVVGCRSRHALAGVVLGSVALQCVATSGCPVLVVHPDRPARERFAVPAPSVAPVPC